MSGRVEAARCVPICDNCILKTSSTHQGRPGWVGVSQPDIELEAAKAVGGARRAKHERPAGTHDCFRFVIERMTPGNISQAPEAHRKTPRCQMG